MLAAAALDPWFTQTAADEHPVRSAKRKATKSVLLNGGILPSRCSSNDIMMQWRVGHSACASPAGTPSVEAGLADARRFGPPASGSSQSLHPFLWVPGAPPGRNPLLGRPLVADGASARILADNHTDWD